MSSENAGTKYGGAVSKSLQVSGKTLGQVDIGAGNSRLNVRHAERLDHSRHK